MQTDLFTVSKLFTERLFRIPDYQRGYAWTEKQLKDYWADLQQLEIDKSHYLGVLTLEDVPVERLREWPEDRWIITSKGYAPFYVVDGQQRLTTTIVLIQAITETMAEDSKLNYTSVEEIKRKFLWDSKDNGISRSYIFGYEKDNPSYEFLKTYIFGESSTSSSTPQDTIYTHNLARAKAYFLERLSSLNIDELQVLYKKITQQLLFNIYAISKEVDVFVAFETMNNRGKPLSHLELLKNRLIYLSTKFDVEDYERVALRSAINESWKSVYHYLGKNKDNPLDDDFFLRNHFLLYFGKDFFGDDESNFRAYRMLRRGYKVAYKEFLLEAHFTTRNIEQKKAATEEPARLSTRDIYTYAQNLKQSVELWYQILNPRDSKFSKDEERWLDKLNRLGIEYVAPLLMAFFQKQKTPSVRVELLKIVEQFIFMNQLLRYRNYMDMDPYTFIDLATKVSAGQSAPDRIVKELKSKLDSMKSNRDVWKYVEKNFRNGGFYEWPGIKYFLYEYDLSLRLQTKTDREKIRWEDFVEDPNDHHTVEHIYPQRPRKKCWTDKFSKFNPKERSALRHSLGNLVPLSRAKNSSFQNKCFDDKKGSAKNKIGFRYGSYAENEIATKRDWTAEEIADRGLSLLDFMEGRWELTIGDRGRKLRML